jgi:glycosyltransferase involved in cell wall biosynthesis
LKKRIQIIYAKSTAEIFNRQSALGSYIFCLAGILIENGYEVRINDVSFSKELKQENKALSGSAFSGSFIKKLVPAFVKEALKDLQLFRWLDNLYACIDTGKEFDKVLEFYTYGSDLGYRLSEKYKKPLVLIYDNPVLEEHNFFHEKQVFFKKKVEARERYSVLSAQSLVVYSNAVKDYLEKKYNKTIPAFIHQNVDYTRFDFIGEKTAEDTLNIGFIGSFLKWHRVDLLLNVFVRLKKEGKNIKLFLLGNGMEYENIKRKVNALAMQKDIVMPGFTDGETLLKYKKTFHIGVMPGSNWYGAPNKIFEYGAAKMAVIAPETPTIHDLFQDGKELLLFRQDDEQDMYLKLKKYLDDPSLLQHHAAELQKKIAENYSKSITFRFYNNLLN